MVRVRVVDGASMALALYTVEWAEWFVEVVGGVEEYYGWLSLRWLGVAWRAVGWLDTDMLICEDLGSE